MSLCENCADKTCYGYSHSILECEDFIPQTNADRIRAMTDEELAGWFGTHACCMAEPFACHKPGGACKRCWTDWLKSPVEEDNGPE